MKLVPGIRLAQREKETNGIPETPVSRQLGIPRSTRCQSFTQAKSNRHTGGWCVADASPGTQPPQQCRCARPETSGEMTAPTRSWDRQVHISAQMFPDIWRCVSRLRGPLGAEQQPVRQQRGTCLCAPSARARGRASGDTRVPSKCPRLAPTWPRGATSCTCRPWEAAEMMCHVTGFLPLIPESWGEFQAPSFSFLAILSTWENEPADGSFLAASQM